MIRPYRGRRPVIADSAYVDESAQVIGAVTLGERTSVWPNTTIRGDVNSIEIRDESNIQDNSCLHVDRDKPLIVGKGCVVGHSVTLHACVVEDSCLIGMGSTVLSGSRIGTGSVIAAGSVVVEGADIPRHSLVVGVPGVIKRETTDDELERIRGGAKNYVDLSREYMKNP